METQEKKESKPAIYWRPLDDGVYAYVKGKGCVIAKNKGEAIARIKDEWPGEYEVLDIVPKPRKENGLAPIPNKVKCQ